MLVDTGIDNGIGIGNGNGNGNGKERANPGLAPPPVGPGHRE
ncbi:hypothetical protein [Streptoalloteichus tenebrarius]|nr:hypothetical protein [Streptoalloteichus tenebrarius]BFF04301.1 hypothetical protein GCM10020241_59760 [Streptoalloteichus tenebrarius]